MIPEMLLIKVRCAPRHVHPAGLVVTVTVQSRATDVTNEWLDLDLYVYLSAVHVAGLKQIYSNIKKQISVSFVNYMIDSVR